MQKYFTVTEYISSASGKTKDRLEKLREVIKKAIPKSTEEKISYGIPYYLYKGRLLYFAYSKNHIGIYFPPPFVSDHKHQLSKYKNSKSGIQFPNSEKMDFTLIKTLINEMVKINEKKSGLRS